MKFDSSDNSRQGTDIRNEFVVCGMVRGTDRRTTYQSDKQLHVYYIFICSYYRALAQQYSGFHFEFIVYVTD